MTLANRIAAALRWLAGCEPCIPPLPKAPDDLEPYCSERVLQTRITSPLSPGEAKALHKIGARYGAQL